MAFRGALRGGGDDGAYTTNGGSLFREYLSQVLSVGSIAFVLWRTEGLQALSTDGEIEDDGREDKGSALRAKPSPTTVGLKKLMTRR